MTINEEHDGHYSCSVARPDDATRSYLFFQAFKMAITGGSIQAAVVQVMLSFFHSCSLNYCFYGCRIISSFFNKPQ